MSEQPDTWQIYLEADEKEDAGDLVGAFDLFMQGARLGDADCQNRLGIIYGAGLGVGKSFSKAMYWHQRAWTTSRQSYLCSGIAVTYAQAGNQKQAEFWWHKALAQGDSSTALPLAKLLLKTRRRHDIARAIALLKFTVSRSVWKQISLADWEEARDLLLQLRKSWRTVLNRRSSEAPASPSTCGRLVLQAQRLSGTKANTVPIRPSKQPRCAR